MKANTSRMMSRLKQAPAKINRMSRNAVNDAARDLAQATPEYLAKSIDNPTPFTTAKGVARVDKSAGARGGDVKARLYIAPAQARYLSRVEHGEDATNYHDPVSAQSRDKRGNVLRKFYRTSAALRKLTDATISTARGRAGKYFVGRPAHLQSATVGIWERLKGNKGLRLVTAFRRKKAFKPSLGMVDEWRMQAPEKVKRHFEAQRKHPANKL